MYILLANRGNVLIDITILDNTFKLFDFIDLAENKGTIRGNWRHQALDSL